MSGIHSATLAILLIASGCAVRAEHGDCGPDAAPRGGSPPAAFEQWCERSGENGEAQLHGTYRAWHDSGSLKAEVRFEDDAASGVGRFWDSDGQLEAES